MKSRSRLDLHTCGFEEEAISEISLEEGDDALESKEDGAPGRRGDARCA